MRQWSMSNTPLRMRADHSVLVMVDYQERLMPVIHDREEVVRRAAFLGRVASELAVPVIGTAQNPSRLGPNDPAVAEHFDEVVEKFTFSAYESGLDVILQEMKERRGLDGVVIAGTEAHVCLAQTALALLGAGWPVWVVADASGSRNPRDRDVAMSRLRHAGAAVVTAEMVAFEWVGTAEHPSFKAVSRLIKEF